MYRAFAVTCGNMLLRFLQGNLLSNFRSYVMQSSEVVMPRYIASLTSTQTVQNNFYTEFLQRLFACRIVSDLIEIGYVNH